MVHWSKRQGGKRLSYLSRSIISGVDFVCGYALDAPPFFLIFLLHLDVFFLFKSSYLFINMHERALAWFTGRWDGMTTVGLRMAGMGNGTPSDLAVVCMHTDNFSPPLFLICLFVLLFKIPTTTA
ncbi:hypothetical protein V8C42DRAFT_300495 [Trichoderma barbatum]